MIRFSRDLAITHKITHFENDLLQVYSQGYGHETVSLWKGYSWAVAPDELLNILVQNNEDRIRELAERK